MNKSGRNFTKDEKKNKKRIEILEVLKKNNVKIIFVVTHFENKIVDGKNMAHLSIISRSMD